MSGGPDLLTIRDVKKHYLAPALFGALRTSPPIRAVDGVTFSIAPHSSVGLVGESGCGKSTLGRLVLGLERPTEGSVGFRGQELHALSGRRRKEFTGLVQAVFQDPWSSLDPRMRIETIIAEPLVANRAPSKKEVRGRVSALLEDVGLDPGIARSYPHELSGGQRQRVAIARALSVGPQLVVLDEPVSSLDVSVRAQIMNLLKDLHGRTGAAFLLIAHNLATVRYLCQYVLVMYLGKIVEMAPSESLFAEPLHPYTKALLDASVPVNADGSSQGLVLSGDVPSPAHPPAGCRFHTRCPYVFDRCRIDEPALREMRPGHFVACHLY